MNQVERNHLISEIGTKRAALYAAQRADGHALGRAVLGGISTEEIDARHRQVQDAQPEPVCKGCRDTGFVPAVGSMTTTTPSPPERCPDCSVDGLLRDALLAVMSEHAIRGPKTVAQIRRALRAYNKLHGKEE